MSKRISLIIFGACAIFAAVSCEILAPVITILARTDLSLYRLLQTLASVFSYAGISACTIGYILVLRLEAKSKIGLAALIATMLYFLQGVADHVLPEGNIYRAVPFLFLQILYALEMIVVLVFYGYSLLKLRRSRYFKASYSVLGMLCFLTDLLLIPSSAMAPVVIGLFGLVLLVENLAYAAVSLLYSLRVQKEEATRRAETLFQP